VNIMIRIRQVKVNVRNDNKEEIIKQLVKKIKISENDIKELKIVKKSLDARFKPNLYYIYEIDILVDNEEEILKKNVSCNDILEIKEIRFTCSVITFSKKLRTVRPFAKLEERW